MLEYGHGEAPNLGRVGDDPVKVINMSDALRGFYKLEQSGEADVVCLVCGMCNQLADDCCRGVGAAVWAKIVEEKGSGASDAVLTAACEEAGMGPLEIFVGLLKLRRGCEAEGCPYKGITAGNTTIPCARRLHMPPAHDCGSDNEEEGESPWRSGRGAYGGEETMQQQPTAASDAATELELLGAESEDDAVELFYYDALDIASSSSSSRPLEEAKPSDGSYRPTHSHLQSLGLQIPSTAPCFFPATSDRAGQAQNVSSLVAVTDPILKQLKATDFNAYSELLPRMEEELAKMVQTRRCLHAMCHRLFDARE